MSLYRPKGIQAEIGGEEHHLLFTLRAVAEIEEHFNAPLSQVIKNLADEKKTYGTLMYILTVLVNDDIFSQDNKAQLYTEDDIGGCVTIHNAGPLAQAVVKAYMTDAPSDDEEEAPKAQRSPRSSTSRGSSTSARRSSASQKTKSGE